MLIIGEKINGTRKQVAEAIRNRDAAFIGDLAVRQLEAGAAYLDVNAGTVPQQEPDDLVWLVETVQAIAPAAKLCLDSGNAAALRAGIARADKPVMLNSVSGETARVEGVLPLALEFQTELIVLALDDKGIPPTAEGRVAVVRSIVERTRAGGLPDEKLYVDPLVLAISTGGKNGAITLETCRRLKAEFPAVHLTCGLSNISFGMPLRSALNQVFLALTVEAGMDSCIVNPEDRELRTAMLAAEALVGRDNHCLAFNRAYRAGKIGPPKAE